MQIPTHLEGGTHQGLAEPGLGPFVCPWRSALSHRAARGLPHGHTVSYYVHPADCACACARECACTGSLAGVPAAELTQAPIRVASIPSYYSNTGLIHQKTYEKTVNYFVRGCEGGESPRTCLPRVLRLPLAERPPQPVHVHELLVCRAISDTGVCGKKRPGPNFAPGQIFG